VAERVRVREIDDDEGRRLVRIIRRGSLRRAVPGSAQPLPSAAAVVTRPASMGRNASGSPPHRSSLARVAPPQGVSQRADAPDDRVTSGYAYNAWPGGGCGIGNFA
jgi:hypothetical protein